MLYLSNVPIKVQAGLSVNHFQNRNLFVLGKPTSSENKIHLITGYDLIVSYVITFGK